MNESMAEKKYERNKTRILFSVFLSLFFRCTSFFLQFYLHFCASTWSAIAGCFFYTSPNTYEAGEMWQGKAMEEKWKIRRRNKNRKQCTWHSRGKRTVEKKTRLLKMLHTVENCEMSAPLRLQSVLCNLDFRTHIYLFFSSRLWITRCYFTSWGTFFTWCALQQLRQ